MVPVISQYSVPIDFEGKCPHLRPTCFSLPARCYEYALTTCTSGSTISVDLLRGRC